MNVALIVVVIYMMVIIVIAILSNRLLTGKNTKNYLLAGQQMPWFLVAVMVTGIAVGGASTVGVAEQAFTDGLSAGWYTIAWSCAAVFFGMLISHKIRNYGIVTVSEIIEKVFGKRDGIIATLMQVFLMFGINATQIVAGGAILSALLPSVFNMTSGMVVSTIIYILTSFLGGYLGASITNLINVIVIYIGLIVGVVYSLRHFDGWLAINMALPQNENWFDFFSGVGVPIIIGWLVTMVMTAPPNQTLFQAAAAARNEKHARNGFIVAAILMGPTGVLAAIIGIIAASQFAGSIDAAMALPAVAMTFPPILAGLVLSGLWAADVSTAIGQLLGISTIFTKNIVLTYINPDMSEKRQILTSKIVLMGTALLGLFVALKVERILDFLMQLMTLYSPYALIILAILYCPQLLRKSSCIAVVGTGIVIMVAWAAVPSVQVTSSVIYLAIPVCLMVLLLCRLVDRRPVDVSKTVDEFTDDTNAY